MEIRKILHILFILLFVVIILLGFYFYSSRREIQVVGNKNYNISYRESALFNEYLNELGIWKKSTQNIHEINIEITDKEQGFFRIFDSIDTQKTLSSSGAFVDTNGILHILIYLNPELANSAATDNINATFMFSLFNILYANSHPRASPDEVFIKSRGSLSKFYKSQKAIPFTITVNK